MPNNVGCAPWWSWSSLTFPVHDAPLVDLSVPFTEERLGRLIVKDRAERLR